MSGPVLGSNNFGTAWGSAIGGLVTWEPFDFGLRGANVDAANAARAQSEATLKRTQFDVAVAAADAYLTLVAAQETVRAAQAGVDRAEVIVEDHQRASECATAARRRPVARGGGACCRTDATDSGAAGGRGLARDTLSVRRYGACRRFAVVSAQSASICLPEQAPAPLDTAANPVLVEQNAVVEQARSAAASAGTVLLPAVLSARRGLCPRHRGGDQWPTSGRPEWARAERFRITRSASA